MYGEQLIIIVTNRSMSKMNHSEGVTKAFINKKRMNHSLVRHPLLMFSLKRLSLP